MDSMRAVQVVGYHENLRMAEVPVPEPADPLDVLVEVGGAGSAVRTCTSSKASGPRSPG